ncbi:MAG: preprotein translocase subunit SecG [Bdellovibrionales bacterium]|nr:preprotein translocase subunit SecG [Bdellovibrionales bacterium]
MIALWSVIHIIMSVLIVVLVLLQDSKGGAMGVFGGGSSNTVFGASGGTNVLVKITTYLAIVFAVTSIVLANKTSSGGSSAVDDYVPTQEQPLNPQPNKADEGQKPSDAK